MRVDVPCRFVPNKVGPFLKRQEGVEVQVRFDIAFPEGTATILLGTIFSAINERGEEFVHQQELLSFHVGTYHCLGKC